MSWKLGKSKSFKSSSQNKEPDLDRDEVLEPVQEGGFKGRWRAGQDRFLAMSGKTGHGGGVQSYALWILNEVMYYQLPRRSLGDMLSF